MEIKPRSSSDYRLSRLHGSSRAKRAHLRYLLSTWPHSFPGCGRPREGQDLGQAHSVAEPILKGTTAQGCLLTVLGAAGVPVLPQGRNSGLQVSVSVTQGVGGQRGMGVAVPLQREWSRKDSMAGSFLSFLVMLREFPNQGSNPYPCFGNAES